MSGAASVQQSASSGQRSAVAAALLFALCGLGLPSAMADASLDRRIARASARLRASPHRVDLLLRRARLLVRAGRARAARVDVQRALRFAPRSSAVALTRARVLVALRRRAEARRVLDAAVARDPSHWLLLARAALHRRAGRVAAAVRDYERVIGAGGGALSHHLALGASLERLARRGRAAGRRRRLLARAAACYRRGLSRLGAATVLRLALVRVERARRRYHAALAALAPLLRAASFKVRWRLQRAELLALARRPKQALAERERALREARAARVRRGSPVIRLLYARALLALGRRREARREVAAIVKQAPRFAPARRLLSRIDAER